MSTLRYAANAKNIINKPRVNEVRPWVLPKIPYAVTICLPLSTQNNEPFKYMGIILATEPELHSLPILGMSSDFMTDSFFYVEVLHRLHKLKDGRVLRRESGAALEAWILLLPLLSHSCSILDVQMLKANFQCMLSSHFPCLHSVHIYQMWKT